MRRRGWVWHGAFDEEYVAVGWGSGGSWQDKPPAEEPRAVIHLPNGERHEIPPAPRRRLGFRNED